MNYTEISPEMFDKIVNFTVNAIPNVGDIEFRVKSTILRHFDDKYIINVGIYVSDFKVTNNDITFYSWDYTKNRMKKVCTLPVDHYCFSEEGNLYFTGVYNDEKYICDMYFVRSKLPF